MTRLVLFHRKVIDCMHVSKNWYFWSRSKRMNMFLVLYKNGSFEQEIHYHPLVICIWPV